MIHWHTSGKMLSWWSTSNMRMFMIHTHNMHINKYRISMNFIYIYIIPIIQQATHVWTFGDAPLHQPWRMSWRRNEVAMISYGLLYPNISTSRFLWILHWTDCLLECTHRGWAALNWPLPFSHAFDSNRLIDFSKKMRPILGWKLINWPLDHSPSTQQIHIRRTTCYLHSWN